MGRVEDGGTDGGVVCHKVVHSQVVCSCPYSYPDRQDDTDHQQLDQDSPRYMEAEMAAAAAADDSEENAAAPQVVLAVLSSEYQDQDQRQCRVHLHTSANYGLSAQYCTESVVVHSACSGCRDVYDFHRSTRVLLQCYHRLHTVF
jgi:hypothetical protein